MTANWGPIGLFLLTNGWQITSDVWVREMVSNGLSLEFLSYPLRFFRTCPVKAFLGTNNSTPPGHPGSSGCSSRSEKKGVLFPSVHSSKSLGGLESHTRPSTVDPPHGVSVLQVVSMAHHPGKYLEGRLPRLGGSDYLPGKAGSSAGSPAVGKPWVSYQPGKKAPFSQGALFREPARIMVTTGASLLAWDTHLRLDIAQGLWSPLNGQHSRDTFRCR